MSKLFYYTGMFSILMLIMLMLLAMFMAFYPFRVADVVQPYRVLNENKSVKRGDSVWLEVSYIKYMNVKTSSERSIICVDGNLVTLSPTSSNFPVGKNTYIISVQIPDKISNGECVYHQAITYFVNPLQIQSRIFESEPFIVVE